MKKFFTTLMLSAFLFNLVGYKLVYYVLLNHADTSFEIALDKEIYNEAKLITVSIPNPLPYQTDWKDFERVDGEMTYKGKIYKYVKRKVEKGQLIIKCLPDDEKTHLLSSKEDFFKLVNDIQSTDKTSKKANSVVKISISEYEIPFQLSFNFSKETALKSYFSLKNKATIKAILLQPAQPPELVTV